MTVVSNASPLITLSKVGVLRILPALFGKVVVATEVFHEVAVVGLGRPGADDVQGASWIEVKSCANAGQFTLWRAQLGFGAGETATILLAQELSANLAIIDERTARGFATSLGLNVMGCVGILESAARKKTHRRFAQHVSAVARKWNLHRPSKPESQFNFVQFAHAVTDIMFARKHCSQPRWPTAQAAVCKTAEAGALHFAKQMSPRGHLICKLELGSRSARYPGGYPHRGKSQILGRSDNRIEKKSAR